MSQGEIDPTLEFGGVEREKLLLQRLTCNLIQSIASQESLVGGHRPVVAPTTAGPYRRFLERLASLGRTHPSRRIAAFRCIPVVAQNSSRTLPFSALLPAL